MMIFMSNCKGIYSSSAVPSQSTHQHTQAPEAPASTHATIYEDQDGYQEHLDVDHPLGRYVAEIEEHELLAYECRDLGHQPPADADSQVEGTPVEIEVNPVASSPNNERDVTPTSVDAPSSISLHPSAPVVHSILPMKRSADAIEAAEDIRDDPEQQAEWLRDIKSSL